MHIGITQFSTGCAIRIDELAREAEHRGFESLFVPEHTHIPTSRRSPWPGGSELPEEYKNTVDPLVGLAYAAASTTRLRIGTAIALLTERDPIVLAKECATLDLLSGGRFELGIGAGWNAEEMENHGTTFKDRFKVMCDRAKAIKTIWREDTPEYHGRFVDFDPIWSYPKPVQKPNPPVLLGGETRYSLERVVDFCEGWMPRTRSFRDAKGEMARLACVRGQGRTRREHHPDHRVRRHRRPGGARRLSGSGGLPRLDHHSAEWARRGSAAPRPAREVAVSTSFVVVAKRDCPTCDLVQPVLHEIAASGAALTVYTQDDPAFPAGLDAIDDRSLEHSWRLDIETVPTLIRLDGGAETERTVGWDRAEWIRVTGLDPLGGDLPEFQPGCGSKSVDPGMPEILEVAFGAPPLTARVVDVPAPEDEHEQCFSRGWSDGLPVVPPTPVRVLRMLKATTRDPQQVIGSNPAEQCTVHGREGRNQRSDGGLQARVHAGRPRSGGDRARARVRNAWPALHHMVLGPDGGRERPDRTPDRHELRCERSRSGQPGKCEHRSRIAARDPQRGRRGSGGHRPGDPRLAGEVHPVLRRGRIRSRLAAAQRGARYRARSLGSHPVRGRRVEPEHGRRLAHTGITRSIARDDPQFGWASEARADH